MTFPSSYRATDPAPSPVGVGLKAQHYREILETRPDIGWFEVHPENYMCAGGPPHRYLGAIRRDYPLSLHSVGGSLGSANAVHHAHLSQLKELVDRYEPFVVSDHLSWSRAEDVFLNDLLPLPYTHDSLVNICRNIDRVQETLNRKILIENPSTYLQFTERDYDEIEFLSEMSRRTGCGLLLDINNVYVSGCNHGFDAWDYLERVPHDQVGEIHLAGHATETLEFDGKSHEIRIDDHGSRITDEVWRLYERYTSRFGQPVTLVEWDTDVPDLNTLLGEARRADRIANQEEVIGHAFSC